MKEDLQNKMKSIKEKILQERSETIEIIHDYSDGITTIYQGRDKDANAIVIRKRNLQKVADVLNDILEKTKQ